MKVRDRVCDICGCSVYEHACHQYKISKRLWEVDTFWKRIDLCEDCYKSLESLINDKFNGCSNCEYGSNDTCESSRRCNEHFSGWRLKKGK